jgi:O-antigen/teichoic acid export membrane protein
VTRGKGGCAAQYGAMRAPAKFRALLGWATVAAGSATARGLSFVASVIVARALGPANFGDFTLFFAVLVVFSTSTQFIDIATVRLASATPSLPNVHALRAGLLAKLALTALFLALAYPIAAIVARLLYDREELTWPLVFAIAAGLCVGLVSFRASMFLAARRYTAYTVLGSVFYVVAVAVLVPVWLARLDLSPSTVYLLFLGSALAVAVPAIAPPAIALRKGVGRDGVVNLARFARWLFAANLLTIILQRLDVILLAHYAGRTEVGLYGAALRVSVVASLLIGALSGFLLPRVALTRVSRAALRRYLRETRLFTALLAGMIGLVWLAAPLLVRKLFGPEFADATSLTRIVLGGTLLLAISAPLAQLLLAGETPRGVFFLNLAKLITLFAVIVPLAPRYGARGVAWAYVGSEIAAVTYVSVSVFLIWRRTPEIAPSGG